MKKTLLAILLMASPALAADGLIERVMHLTPDPSRHIPVHRINASFSQVMVGDFTVAQLKAFFGMTPEDETDLDNLITIIQAEPNDGYSRRLMALWVNDVFILAHEANDANDPIPTHDTPAEVRAILGIPEP